MRYRRRRGLGSRGTSGGGSDGSPSPSDPERARLRSRALRWGVSAVAAAALFGIGYLVASQWLFSGSAEAEPANVVEVPELVGLGAEEAEAVLERRGLVVRVRSQIDHPRAPAGAVVAQRPLPGQFARPGAPVSVTLSLGPERRKVPDVRGLSARHAGIVVERMGFRPTVDSVGSRVTRGRVVGSRPGPGEEATLPASVRLLVSRGPRVRSVPELEGRHLNDVEEILRGAGLEIGRVEYDPEAYVAPGRVIGQSPPPGYALRAGGEVSVRVAGERDDLEPRFRGLGPPGLPDLGPDTLEGTSGPGGGEAWDAERREGGDGGADR